MAMAGKEKRWVASIFSTAPVVDDSTGNNIQISVIDKRTDTLSIASVVDASWEREEFDDGKAGWSRKGTIAVPADMTEPGAVLIRKLDPNQKDDASTIEYIRHVKVATEETVFEFPAHSWVSSVHKDRIFFEGHPYLPKDTPPTLADERRAELARLREMKNGPIPKDPTDRSYAYQVYDDLATDKLPRPALGGSAELPYPRHLSNDKQPEGAAWGEPWLPFDEQFDFSKQQGFNGDLLAASGPALIQTVRNLGDLGEAFDDFDDVYRMFEGGSSSKTTWSATVDAAEMDKLDKEVEPSQLGPLRRLSSRLVDVATKIAPSNVKSRLQDLLRFEAPKVMAGRQGVWDTDEEWGRQVLAGLNPVVLTALSKLPDQLGSAIKPEHVDTELRELGSDRTMAQLVADTAAGQKPRLFLIDHWLMDTFWDEAPDAKDRTEHAGRCLLFLTQSPDGQETGLIPIAIELKHRKTNVDVKAKSGVVYSRQELKNDQQNLWRLAKAVFKSIDSGYHQLVSHWLRCHACIEPFNIAMRRQISAMHPVYKLMVPHFRYTLDINHRARKSLINAGGTIESTFTPGAYGMRLCSAVYGALWRFVSQAPLEDLKARGLISGEGKLWLDDYPYAQDGLDIWREITAYFGQYLRLYYKSDADVLDDEELQAWWAEVKAEGHPDMQLVEKDEAKVWGFAGPIPSIDALTQVLGTIAWTASAHHSAVNFSQYDYSGLMLNVPSLIRRPIPRPGDQADKAWQALVAASGRKAEKALLTYLPDPKSTLKDMITVQLLSIHAEDEQTLDERNLLLTDPAAVALNSAFMARMEALEAVFEGRNSDPGRWTRYAGRKQSLAYTLLEPPSPAGLTMKGVPYSVSI